MPNLKLDKKYLTGIDRLDEQHTDVLYFIDYAMEGIRDSKDPKEYITSIVQKAKRYIDFHLKYEEMLMQESGYEDIEEHFKQHNAFRKKVISLEEKKEGNINDLKDVALFLRDWLLNHIPIFDRPLGIYLSSQRIKDIEKTIPDQIVPAYLEGEGVQIPIFILGQHPIENKNLTYSIRVCPENKKNDFFKLTDNIISQSFIENQDIVGQKQRYITVPKNIIELAPLLSLEIFVKEEKNGVLSYKKILSKKEPFRFSKIEKEYNDNECFFYIKDEDVEKVVGLLASTEEKKAEQEETTPISTKVFFNEDDFSSLDDETLPLGLKKLNISLSAYQRGMNSLKNSATRIKDFKDLSSYLALIISDHKKIIYKQNILLLFLGTEYILSNKLDRPDERIEQWVFSSLFHDIALQKNESHLLIRSDFEMQLADLTGIEKENIIYHAQNALKIVDQCTNLPMGTRSLIMQHHGSQIGSGLPKDSFNVSQTALEFLFIEHLVHKYAFQKMSLEESIKETILKYSGQKHEEIIQKFFNILKKK